MEPFKDIVPAGSRGKACVLVAAAFLFFVLYSAPHRVHHLLEQAPFAPAQTNAATDGGHSASDNHHGHNRIPKTPGTNPADCAVQSLAQNAHASTPALIGLPAQTAACSRRNETAVAWTASFNPSPFAQRAPPLA
jgi:hypothetical protein